MARRLFPRSNFFLYENRPLSMKDRPKKRFRVTGKDKRAIQRSEYVRELRRSGGISQHESISRDMDAEVQLCTPESIYARYI